MCFTVSPGPWATPYPQKISSKCIQNFLTLSHGQCQTNKQAEPNTIPAEVMQQLQCSRKKIQSSTYSHSKKPTQAVSFSINIIHLHFK